nr:MAG TPA: tail tape measure [Caudoviricetes sp.]
MAVYEGGAVGISIYPDTTDFGFELRRKLAKYADDSLTIPLNIDVDDANWTAAKRRINNDRLSKTVEVRGDTSALRKAVQDIEERDISPKVDLTKQLRDLRSLRQRVKAANRSFQKFNRSVDTSSAKFKHNKTLVKQYGDAMDKASTLTRKYGDRQINVLDKTKRRIRTLQDAILKFKPLGSNVVEMNEANLAIAKIRREIKQLENDPGAKIRIDIDRYAKVISNLENVARKTDELNRKEARIKFYTDGADKLKRELDDLRRRYVNLPKEIETSYRQAIDRMNTAGHLAGRDKDFKYVANLDLDVSEARRKARDFQNDHDKLEMDLDLKSAAASAHLMYLTRPRSVEIYAKLHATDMGKLIDGMLYGATGLRGVNNQFQRLVNLFDTLDTKVPVLGAVGAVIGGVSAGAVNLSSSVLGVAASLGAMSKAAFAAPAAITGLGAAFVVLKHAWGDKGGTFSDQIDIASTKLAGFGDAMDEAFYEKARPAIRSLMDDVSGTLIPGMTGIASSEGKVVEGLADIIRESDKAGELSTIFSRTSEAVDNLNPGLQSVVESFLRLGDGTSQYLPRAASYFSDMASKFADWVDKTRATGEIVASMKQVVEQAGYLKDSFKGVWGIATGLYSALAESQNGLEGFSTAVGKADRAVNSARFQTTFKAWAKGAEAAKNEMRDAFSDIGSAAYELRDTTAGMFTDAGNTISSFTSNASRLLKNSKDGISGFSSGVSEGFQKVFSAVGDASPAFNQLLKTVGQLSKTFGGTLAATLKASAPLITTVAKAAEATAKAFSVLPEPIQAAIGLYATFGRAGMTAWNTVKTGLVENTLRMVEYQKALNGLGVTTKTAGSSMKDAVSGFVAANPSLKGIADNVRNANGVLGKTGALAKGAGNAILGAFGGPVGAAVTAGVAVVTAAYSEYVKTTQANEQASENIRTALEKIPDSAQSAAEGITEVGKAIKENFDNTDYSGTKFDWWSDMTTGFDSVSDAAKKLGLNVSDLTKSVTGSQAEYQATLDRLDATIEKYNVNVGHGIGKNADLARAAQKVKTALEDQRNEYIANSEAIAQANGYAEGYATKLIKLGEDSDSVSIAISTQAERTQMLAKAQQTAADWAERQRTAQQNALNAASDYGETYSNMGDAIARVNQLAAQSGPVWDANAAGIQGVTGSFNTMSEAGREAQSALENLGNSGHDLLKSMVESGASADVVKAKQAELAKQFLATADSMGIPADAAQRLQQIYGLTPEEVTTLFKAETEQTKTALTQYLSNLRAIFPGDGNTAVFQTILEGINSGAITSMDQVSSKMDELRKNVSTDGSGKYTIVLDADGTQAIVATDIVKKHAELFKAGSDGNGYTTKLNADDLTKATLDYVEGNLNAYDQLAPSADLNAKDNSGPAKASADANASNWDAQHPTASFDGDAAGAANAKRSASNQGWQWNGSTYNAQFGASTESVSSSFWSAMQSGWEWAKQKFFAVFGVKRQNAEGGEVAGSGVTKTGRVVGQGNNTSDSVPLNAYTDVSTGEYVIRKAAVQSMENLYGRGIMAAINATGSIPSKYIADARRTSQITMPSGGLNGGSKSGGWSMPIETSSGDTYNQTFIYPSVTPIEVQKNNKLDQYANLGLLQ